MTEPPAHDPLLEFRLAAACAMWPPSDARVSRVLDLSQSAPDWRLFLAVIKRHRICSIARNGLAMAGVNPPSGLAAEIAEAAGQESRQEVVLAGAALRLQSLFLKSGISAFVLKGVPLALNAFGRLGLRSHRDIDFLVPPVQMLEAASLLEIDGYLRVEPSPDVTGQGLQAWLSMHKDLAFEHRDSGIVVELHSRLFDNSTLIPQEHSKLKPQLIALTAQHSFRTLPGELNFIYLCRHGSEHAWSRLKWLADIGALLSSCDVPGIEHYYQAAEDMGLERSVAVAILLSAELFGTRVPQRIINLARRDWRVRALIGIAMRSMTGGRGCVELEEQPFGTTLKNLSHYLISERWTYWRREFAYDIADTSDTPVPSRLSGATHVLRPMLWVWQRARHGGRGRVPEADYGNS